ncbi:MAG: class B sortase [Clostridia bacterium]|nr:class B sortase [Clostridia bacterium]
MARRSKKTKQKRRFTFYIFPILSLAVAAYCTMYIVQWFNENGQNKEVLETIVGDTIEVNDETGETAIDFAKLKEKNSDTVGWLKVAGTSVDYPVVKSSDNSFYLTRNFNKTNNIAGWIFADYRDKVDGEDINLVIYGHNMKDGSMFGTVKKCLNKDWYNNEENLNITFETDTKVYTYKVFSVYQIEVETYYTKTGFENNASHLEWLNKLKSRSVKDFGVALDTNSKVITLSTCASNSNYRVALHGVLTNVTSKI